MAFFPILTCALPGSHRLELHNGVLTEKNAEGHIINQRNIFGSRLSPDQFIEPGLISHIFWAGFENHIYFLTRNRIIARLNYDFSCSDCTIDWQVTAPWPIEQIRLITQDNSDKPSQLLIGNNQDIKIWSAYAIENTVANDFPKIFKLRDYNVAQLFFDVTKLFLFEPNLTSVVKRITLHGQRPRNFHPTRTDMKINPFTAAFAVEKLGPHNSTYREIYSCHIV